jgi:uncharacterized protein YjbI with pentapeptide repeats
MDDETILQKKIEALNDGSKIVRSTYLTYLLAAVYIGLTTTSTTHVHLLSGDISFPLPVIGVALPVISFYIVAPFLLFILHLNFLVHVSDHSQYLAEAKYKMQGKINLSTIVHPSMYSQYFLDEKKEGSHGVTSFFRDGFVLFSFFYLVPLLTLYIQYKFLPYHSWGITFEHKALVLLSIITSLIFYLHIIFLKCNHYLYDEKKIGAELQWAKETIQEQFLDLNLILFFKRRIIKKTIKFLYFLSILIFILIFPLLSFFTISIPETNKECLEDPIRKITSIINFQWAKEISCTKTNKYFVRNLKLKEKVLAPHPSDTLIAKFENDPQKLLEFYGTLDLQKRDLRFSDLSRSNLTKADLRGARLQKADLSYAHLEGANLEAAKLQEAKLIRTKLQGANLKSAQLQGAELAIVNLQGAFVVDAGLEGANLILSQLQGALLKEARLQGANLFGSNLQGANLSSAKLQGANLSNAKLQAAYFSDSNLQGANLSNAKLQGATLERVEIEGAIFEKTDLSLLDLSKLNLEKIKLKIPETLLFNSIVQPREDFEKRIQDRAGKITTISPLHNVQIIHSYKKYPEKQRQFKDIISLKGKPFWKIRDKIFENMLCTHPVLIKKQIELAGISYFKRLGEFSLGENKVINYVKKNCSEHIALTQKVPKIYSNYFN